jgi:antitoxin CptB
MNRTDRLKRLRFRAWHRGTKEADLLIGGFFDRHHETWSDDEVDWYERLLEEQDVGHHGLGDRSAARSRALGGEMMRRMRQVDYIRIPE